MIRALAEAVVAGAIAAIAALLLSALAILAIATGPALALGAALWFYWTRSSSFRTVAFAFLVVMALYGAATAGAMFRLVSR